MAAARKSAKRSAPKKRSPAKGQSKKKPASRKKAGSSGAVSLSRRAKKGLKVARGAWKTLKSTTAQVVEGVKDTLAGDDRPKAKRSRSR